VDRPILRLLYFSHSYTTHDRRFLQAFVGAGYDVSYLRLTAGRLDQRALPDGVRLLSWVGDRRPLRTLPDYLARYFALRHLLAGEHPQVVLAGPVQTAAFLVALTGYNPLVAMSWGSDMLVDAHRNVWLRAVTRYTLHRAAGALGDCRAVREQLRAFSALSAAQIVTFPWGIEDFSRLVRRPAALSLRQRLGWTDNPVLLSTRTWEPVYAVDVLVRAFAALLRMYPEARLLLLGDGSQAEEVHQLINRLHLAEYIHVPGRISNASLPDYFCAADLYVSSALSDGTSISLLEAMACGLPVVVTNGFGNLEWVQPGKNGWLAAPGDVAALADTLSRALASDAEQLWRMRRANIALVHEKADWQKNFPQLLQLLQQVARRSADDGYDYTLL